MVQKRKSTLERQAQIVEAARKLIIKYGSEHLTVRRIAREIGVSEGALYRHFQSKRDILSLLVDHIEHSLLEDVKEEATARPPVLNALDDLLRNHISSIEQRKGVSFQIIAEIISLGDKKLNQKVTEAINRYIDRIRDILQRGIVTGEVRPDLDLDAAASLLFSMIQGLVNIWALSGYSFNLEQRYLSAWRVFEQAVSASALSAVGQTTNEHQ